MAGKDLSLRLRLRVVEIDLCRKATRAQSSASFRTFFRAVSWLGDGPAWFALAILVPLLGGLGELPIVARMAVLGIAATLVSKGLKAWIGRPRPYLAHDGIAAGARALDEWSFPSGHTLHAVAFTALLTAEHPPLALILVPFTLAVAASRVVLGLHYPSDVAAGAGLGGALAAAALWLF